MPVRSRIRDVLALPGVPLAMALTPLVGHRPKPISDVPPLRPTPRQPLNRGDRLTVLSWNIQFCGSRREEFFYDGGPRVHVPAEDATETLAGICAALKEAAPSITLLQEVDRGARRTGYVDQFLSFRDHMPPASAVSAPYWQVPFVPTPPSQPLGRVNMHLCTMTPHGIDHAQRHQLALLQEPSWRQHFNLKRALLTSHIPIVGGGHLIVANTHLSAFSYGDGTLNRQVDALAEWMDSHPPDQPWILAGDFNLLPPNDSPARLQLNRPLYNEAAQNPINTLIPRFKTTHDVSGEGPLTYLPHGASSPDRTIDYIFYGGPLRCLHSTVLVKHSTLSDHLPLWAELRLDD